MPSPLASPHVRILQASAGSGKTYALAKRYVQLLLSASRQSPLSLKNILAITFTNKAAHQMKAKIFELLKKMALGQMPDKEAKEILDPINMTIDTAKPLANDLMSEIIRYYHFFNVSTIDSFMNTLLAGCAFKINLSARFKIKRNISDYMQLSLDQLIDQAHHNKEVRVLFETFIRQYLFLENRSGWFPKKDLQDVLMILFSQLNTYQKPILTYPLNSNILKSIF